VRGKPCLSSKTVAPAKAGGALGVPRSPLPFSLLSLGPMPPNAKGGVPECTRKAPDGSPWGPYCLLEAGYPDDLILWSERDNNLVCQRNWEIGGGGLCFQ
jgi:hypothetical protein